jgi:hypothetical protein
MTETPMRHSILLAQGTMSGSTEVRHVIADIQSLPFTPPHDSFLYRFSSNNVTVYHSQSVVYSVFGIHPIPFLLPIARLSTQELLVLPALPLLPVAGPARMESAPYWLRLDCFGSCPSDGKRSLSALHVLALEVALQMGSTPHLLRPQHSNNLLPRWGALPI